MLVQNINRHKRKAQHIVEFTLMMPIFIIIFSWIIQVLAETYSKYKFSYIFSSSIVNAVSNQKIYDNMDDSERENYSLADNAENIVKNKLRVKNTNFLDVSVKSIPTERVVFLISSFTSKYTLLFAGRSGAYFYFTIPVGTAFAAPPVLDETETSTGEFFNSYYDIYKSSIQEGLEISE